MIRSTGNRKEQIEEPRETDTGKMSNWVMDLLTTLSIIMLKTNRLSPLKKAVNFKVAVKDA